MLELKNTQYESIHKRLIRNAPDKKAAEAGDQTAQGLKKSLNRAMQTILAEKKKDFSFSLARLESVSPLKVMERGYSLAFTEDQKLISKVSQVKPNDQITIQSF